MKTTEIFSSDLPVGEKLSIKRTRFEPSSKSSKKLTKTVLLSYVSAFWDLNFFKFFS